MSKYAHLAGQKDVLLKERALRMFKYRIVKKNFSLSRHYSIMDEQDKLCFEAKGSYFSWSSKVDLMGVDGRKHAFIHGKIFSLRPTYYIELENGSTYRFVKTFKIKDRIFVDSVEGDDAFVIEGNLWQKEYQFRRSGEEVAFVSKKLFSFNDKFGVAVKNESDAILVLSCVLALHMVHERQRSAAS